MNEAAAPGWRRWAARLVATKGFWRVTILVIIANAIVIGMGTFNLDPRAMRTVNTIDPVFLGVFVAELLIRMAADGFNLKRFFGNGWNAFDFFVVAICFVPGVSTSTSALRIVRLLRVSRLLRVMPDIAVLMRGLRRAAPPALSLAALTVLLCYLYAVIGWMLFGGKTPPGMHGYFDNIGEAMLTLFELLTLEGWNSVLHDLRQISGWALPFVISFLLIGTYIVVNLVVGIVITSLDEAYKERDKNRQQEQLDADGTLDSPEATIAELREMLTRLEVQLEARAKVSDEFPDDDIDTRKAAARLL